MAPTLLDSTYSIIDSSSFVVRQIRCLPVKSNANVYKYNSVVFQTTSTNEHIMFTVPHNYLKNAPMISTSILNSNQFGHRDHIEALLLSLTQSTTEGRLKYMSNQECIQEYSTPLQNSISNGFLITSDKNQTLAVWAYPWIPLKSVSSFPDWLCEEFRHARCVLPNPDDWKVDVGVIGSNYTTVEQCLAQTTVPQCTLQFIPDRL